MEVPLWETVPGPDHKVVRYLLKNFWIPNLATPAGHFVLMHNVIIVTDEDMAYYILEMHADIQALVSYLSSFLYFYVHPS